MEQELLDYWEYLKDIHRNPLLNYVDENLSVDFDLPMPLPYMAEDFEIDGSTNTRKLINIEKEKQVEIYFKKYEEARQKRVEEIYQKTEEILKKCKEDFKYADKIRGIFIDTNHWNNIEDRYDSLQGDVCFNIDMHFEGAYILEWIYGLTRLNPLYRYANQIVLEILRKYNSLYDWEKEEEENYKFYLLWKKNKNPETNNQAQSSSIVKFKLSKKEPGAKINIIRILNALYQLKYIIKENEEHLTKQEFMESFGKFIGEDLSKYHVNLSQSLKEQPLETNLAVFNDMIETTKNAHYEIKDKKK